MKRLRWLCLFLLPLFSTVMHGSPKKNADVLAPIERFFTALANRDSQGMQADVAPHVEVMNNRNGQLRRLPIEKLAALVADADPGSTIAEPISHPIVHVDQNVAVVWAPYKFLIDGKVHHCGTDVFTLSNVEGRWQIVGLADNLRTDCK